MTRPTPPDSQTSRGTESLSQTPSLSDSPAPSDASSATPGDSIEPTCELQDDPLVQRMVRILDRYLSDLKAGKAVSRATLLAAHPDLAERLESYLAGIEFLNPVAGQAVGGDVSLGAKELGDFRVGREVGRGGMGAVYEAEQISLGRRVALKVLRFGPVSDPQAIDRFQREAETVANLHHTNIVPLYSVGSVAGVNYYAMQFIDGESLDRVLRHRQEPLDQQLVASWGMQAAEALSHAHARHVIHRDVKPSNLILDEAEGRLWLTDFGLAKRLDDVTLSMTGALLGTPRYMSPEQADATRLTIDHRTDLYSLGATLYELLTGQPVFSAETPHAVLNQILTAQPDRLRQHRPTLDRDLETIVMTCLAKDPSERYPSAQKLSDDLRAYLDGRSIQARRPGLIEIVVKSVKKRKQSVALAVGTFVAAMLFFVASLVSYFTFQQSQMASVGLQTATPPLVGELTDAQGIPLSEPQTLPTQRPLEIRSGEIELRVSGRGQLSQTYQTSLLPQERRAFDVDLTDNRMGPSLRFDQSLRLIRVPIVESGSGSTPSAERATGEPTRLLAVALTEEGLQVSQIVDGHPALSSTVPSAVDAADSGKPRWMANSPGFRWSSVAPFMTPQSGYDKFDLRPFIAGQVDVTAEVVEIAPDLNGDGVADLVIAARHQAWWLALSGTDLTPIWFAPRGTDVTTDQSWPGVVSASVAAPLTAGDLDGDGVADLVGVFADASDLQQPRRWVEAISGADGKTLWRTEFRPEWFQLPGNAETPYAFRWFVRGNNGMSSSGSGSWSAYRGIVTRRYNYDHTRGGTYVAVPDRPRLFGEQLRILAGNRLVSVDLTSGKLVDAAAIDSVPTQPVIWSDFDGDGQPDALFVQHLGDRAATSGYPPATASLPHARVTAWSIEGQVLWQRDIIARRKGRPEWNVEPARWPTIADINGDGASDVVLPNGTSAETKKMGGIPWGNLQVLDGRNGSPFWSRRIPSMDEWAEHVTAGPDVDGDGWADLFSASLWGNEYDLFVDCLSGADGTTLWQTRQSLRDGPGSGDSMVVSAVDWWKDGRDGAPTLLVTTQSRQSEGDADTYLFSAASGKLSHQIREPDELIPADVDGDGVEDLAVIYDRVASRGREGGGVLNCVRGLRGERWRRMMKSAMPAVDYDGDGIRDLIVYRGQTLHLHSGANGGSMWEAELPERLSDPVVAGESGTTMAFTTESSPQCARQPSRADLNGDGVPDIVLCQRRGMQASQRPLTAYSGASGRQLWTADLDLQNIGGVLSLEVKDLDRDGQPEVVLLIACDWDYPRGWSYSSANEQLWVAVFAGASGHVRWKQALSPSYGNGARNSPYDFSNCRVELAIADLNGDGIDDLVVPADSRANPGSGMECRAVSGRDGSLLWAVDRPSPRKRRDAFERLIPVSVGDLNGDGQTEVVQASVFNGAGNAKRSRPQLRVRLLRGSDGEELWQWQTEIDPDYDRLNSWPFDWWARPRMQLVRRADGTLAIAAVLQRPDRSIDLVAIDRAGKPLAEVSIAPPRSPLRGDSHRLLISPGTEQSEDRLIFRRPDEVVAIGLSDPENPVWSFTDLKAEDRVLGMVGGGPKSGQGDLLVASSHRLVGIECRSGTARWRCSGPVPRVRETPLPIEDMVPLTVDAQAAPLVSFSFGDVLLCRQAQAIDSPSQAASARMLSARTSPLNVTLDPRVLRPLPWNHGEFFFWNAAISICWSIFFAVTLLVVPLAYLGYLVFRRRFSLRTLMLAPVVLSTLFIGVSVNGPDQAMGGLSMKLFQGATVLPPLLATLWLVYWCVMGRWRLVSFWLGLSVVIAAALFLVGIFALDPVIQGTALPEERWSFDGWYVVWLLAAVLTAWLIAGFVLLRGGWAAWKRLRRRNRDRPAVATA